MSKSEIIQLSLQMPFGSKGVDHDPNNPLSCALSRLLVEGKPVGILSLCFFGDPVSVWKGRSTPKWLGAMAHLKRLIFFPGLNFSSDWIKTYQGQSLNLHRAFKVDHISLERSLLRWHFTTPGSKKHQGGGRTMPLGDGRHLWFGMSLADENVLRELKEETTASWLVPSSDSIRRMQALKPQINQDIIVSLPEDNKRPSEKAFLHFALIVGPKGFTDYEGEMLGIPFGSPFLIRPLAPTDIVPLPVRSHRLSFGRELDLEILCMRLPGELTVPVTFTVVAPPKENISKM